MNTTDVHTMQEWEKDSAVTKIALEVTKSVEKLNINPNANTADMDLYVDMIKRVRNKLKEYITGDDANNSNGMG